MRPIIMRIAVHPRNLAEIVCQPDACFMRLLLKLLVVVALPAILIWAVGSYATTASDTSLRCAIQQRSAAQARALMDEIDRLLHTRIANWRAYARSQLVQTALRQSNEQFAAMEDVAGYVKQADEAWIQVPDGELSPLMQELSSNELAKDLRLWLDKLEEASGFPVYGEVFLTNAYGANVAQTRRTTDYDQRDEDWWLQAKAQEKGWYVGNAEKDASSNMFAIPICLRVNDSQGTMLGVLKAVLNMHEISGLIDARAAGDDQPIGQTVMLFSNTRQILHQVREDQTSSAGGAARPTVTDGAAYFQDLPADAGS